jgi:hypothetical protein
MITAMPTTNKIPSNIACIGGIIPSLNQSLGRIITGDKDPGAAEIPELKFTSA